MAFGALLQPAAHRGVGDPGNRAPKAGVHRIQPHCNHHPAVRLYGNDRNTRPSEVRHLPFQLSTDELAHHAARSQGQPAGFLRHRRADDHQVQAQVRYQVEVDHRTDTTVDVAPAADAYRAEIPRNRTGSSDRVADSGVWSTFLSEDHPPAGTKIHCAQPHRVVSPSVGKDGVEPCRYRLGRHRSCRHERRNEGQGVIGLRVGEHLEQGERFRDGSHPEELQRLRPRPVRPSQLCQPGSVSRKRLVFAYRSQVARRQACPKHGRRDRSCRRSHHDFGCARVPTGRLFQGGQHCPVVGDPHGPPGGEHNPDAHETTLPTFRVEAVVSCHLPQRPSGRPGGLPGGLWPSLSWLTRTSVRGTEPAGAPLWRRPRPSPRPPRTRSTW